MRKSVSLTLCIVLVALLSSLAMSQTVTARWLNDTIIVGTTNIMEITIVGNPTSWNTFSFTPSLASGEDSSLITYKLVEKPAHYSEPLYGHSEGSCWDAKSGQFFIRTSVTSTGSLRFNAASTSYNPPSIYSRYFNNESITPLFVINCGVAISAKEVPTSFNFVVSGGSGSSPFQVAFPSGGFVTPQIDFKSASLSQSKDDPYSSAQVEIAFTTDTAGVFDLTLVNGPLSSPINHDNGKYADFYCTQGSNKKFAPIHYIYDEKIQIVVPEGSKKEIKCHFLFENAASQTFVHSDRLAVQMQMGSAIVSRSVEYKLQPAGLFAWINSNQLEFQTTQLPFSSTPLNINSTIVLKFSKTISVQDLIIEESGSTSYRANSNCNVDGTSFVDIKKNTITLKDVVPSDPYFACAFEVYSTDSLLIDHADTASIEVSIDGKSLAATNASGNAAPVYVSTVGTLESQKHVENEENDNIIIEDVLSFTDNYSNSFSYMRNPIITLAISGEQMFNIENFSNQLKCQTTRPEESGYHDLKLSFDKKMMTWSAKLGDLTNELAFSILIKCTRSVPKLVKYGLDITPSSSLQVAIVNLIDGKRFLSPAELSIAMNARIQSKTQTGSYPTGQAVSIIRVSAPYYLPSYSPKLLNQTIQDHAATMMAQLKANSVNDIFGFTPLSNFVQIGSQDGPYRPYHAESNIYDYISQTANDLKSFIYQTLGLFTRTNPIIRFDTSTQLWPLVINQFFKGESLDSQMGVPSATLVDLSPRWIKFLYSQLQIPYQSKPIIAPQGNDLTVQSNVVIPSSTTSWTPFGCGVEDGFALPVPVQTGSNLASYYATSSWSTFVQSSSGRSSLFLDTPDYRNAFKCSVGHSCTYNADCTSGNFCQKGVCTTLETYNPPFVQVSDSQSKAFDKYFFNSSSMNSIIGALIVVIVAIIA